MWPFLAHVFCPSRSHQKAQSQHHVQSHHENIHSNFEMRPRAFAYLKRVACFTSHTVWLTHWPPAAISRGSTAIQPSSSPHHPIHCIRPSQSSKYAGQTWSQTNRSLTREHDAPLPHRERFRRAVPRWNRFLEQAESRSLVTMPGGPGAGRYAVGARKRLSTFNINCCG